MKTYGILGRMGLFFVSVACLVLAIVGMSGCTTTTLPDGTVVQAWDLDGALQAYLLVRGELERLEAQEAREDAADEAARQAQLRETRAMLEAWGARLMEAGAHYVQDSDGLWVSVQTGKVVKLE